MPVRISHILLLCGLLQSAGCASIPVARLDDGSVHAQLQPLDTKIQQQAEQFERLLQERGAVYDDPTLTQYLQRIGDRVLAAYPAVVRSAITFRIVRDPSLNAYALAHGTICLTTGALARLQNDDQIALLLGHEVAHVLHRDMLAFVQSLHRKTVAAKVTDLLLTPPLALFGAGALSETGLGLIYQASVTGYARDLELRADEEGSAAMTRAGYDAQQAAHLFQVLVEDEAKYRHPRRWAFLQTHPTAQQRLASLTSQFDVAAEQTLAAAHHDAAYRSMTDSVRYENIVLHFRLQEYARALEMADGILSHRPHEARAQCYRGEAYRLMAADWMALKEELSTEEWRRVASQERDALHALWRRQARRAYRAALALDANFAESYRGLGLLNMAMDERDDAITNLETYLRYSPHAPDRRYVTSQIKRLQQRGGP